MKLIKNKRLRKSIRSTNIYESFFISIFKQHPRSLNYVINNVI